MSAIQKELCEACGIDPAKYSERAKLHAAIVTGVNGLTDKQWDAISEPAQDWFNAAADETKSAKKAGRDPNVPEFPDYEASSSSSRSRRRSSEDDDAPKGGESMAIEKVKEGDRVKITTKRGKVYEGEVVEQNKRKEFIAIKGSDGEDEIDWDKVDSVEVFHGTAGTTKEQDAGPEVGDVVSFKTTRGKKIEGELTEITDDILVIDKEDEYSMEKIDGDITIVKKGGGGGKSTREEPETRSRGRSSSSSDDKGGKDEEKGRAGNPRGVSVGGRIRELVADDFNISKEDVIKTMKKEGIEFKDATVNILYRDAMGFIELLRKAKKLK